MRSCHLIGQTRVYRLGPAIGGSDVAETYCRDCRGDWNNPSLGRGFRLVDMADDLPGAGVRRGETCGQNADRCKGPL